MGYKITHRLQNDIRVVKRRIKYSFIFRKTPLDLITSSVYLTYVNIILSTVKGLVRRQQGKEERVEFTVPRTANYLRASRRRAVRAQRFEDERKKMNECFFCFWSQSDS
jgi:hypothetical protein